MMIMYILLLIVICALFMKEGFAHPPPALAGAVDASVPVRMTENTQEARWDFFGGNQVPKRTFPPNAGEVVELFADASGNDISDGDVRYASADLQANINDVNRKLRNLETDLPNEIEAALARQLPPLCHRIRSPVLVPPEQKEPF